MRDQSVKVCKGPNCKAWSSDQIARELRTLEMCGIKICRAPCMDACHGGVSVRVNSKKKVLKLKDAEDVLTVLGIQEPVAC
tara:strand:- start:194 stop:436 length:243 start_codon:yes stop_codon:yes gene_type:complete